MGGGNGKLHIVDMQRGYCSALLTAKLIASGVGVIPVGVGIFEEVHTGAQHSGLSKYCAYSGQFIAGDQDVGLQQSKQNDSEVSYEVGYGRAASN